MVFSQFFLITVGTHGGIAMYIFVSRKPSATVLKDLGILFLRGSNLKWPHSQLAIPVNISDCEYVTLFCCDFLKTAEVHYGFVYVQISVHAKENWKETPDTSHMNVWVFPINFVVVWLFYGEWRRDLYLTITERVLVWSQKNLALRKLSCSKNMSKQFKIFEKTF